jgi:hypothetical protein
VHDLWLRRLRQETMPGRLDVLPGRLLLVLPTVELGQQEVYQRVGWLQDKAGMSTVAGPGMQTHAGKHHGQDIPGLRL